jgi:hypothetical protein
LAEQDRDEVELDLVEDTGGKLHEGKLENVTGMSTRSDL